ncbi:PP2C-domain-containing protein [Tilletiaria anomala UBC 951]|uniref:PP2C-domain-containing protein n=1 Tax=Tilletiaria anomala (strain ATCC 24038 / CBS 436.72 / UBC 951) TaxID=1037660 RepID=A0A066W2N5_TILAU|nr:PP2C-domain-containing protein [Tilletiaria anomala UBC 951]KDN46803.1 PP2C-domain-containing protein [Tilletiaria anomala UBC 951]
MPVARRRADACHADADALPCSTRPVPCRDDPSLDAKSEQMTIAGGSNTHGKVNQHPASSTDGLSPHVDGIPVASSCGSAADGDSVPSTPPLPMSRSISAVAGGEDAPAAPPRRIPFRVGVAEDRNKRWRRTMEDSHAFVYNFGGVQGQGFFSVFDGHAGKHSAEWCGKHFHEYFLQCLASSGGTPVPDVLNETFHQVDTALSKVAQEQGTSSGCTAVTVFLRLEDDDGVPVTGAKSGGVVPDGAGQGAVIGGASAVATVGTNANVGGIAERSGGGGRGGDSSSSSGRAGAVDVEAKEGTSKSSSTSSNRSSSSGGLFGAFSKRARQASKENREGNSNGTSGEAPKKRPALVSNASGLVTVTGTDVRRVLYTANVGDARAVLCRGGKAIRLTYDHKGSDAQEAKRITDAGGFVMNNRVNGVLAVTRSLGDSSMKEFVVGAPYTTETRLTEEDSLLIVACDGLWDVVDDQDAVELVKDVQDAQEAADLLLKHALQNFSTDNTSVMVVRFAVPASAVTDPRTD